MTSHTAALRQTHRRLSLPVPQWELDAAITVVLFAGLGGACEGLEDAGCPVHVANNHDAVALAAHAANHPHTRHIRGDIFDVDPIVATGGRPVKILWASPDCRDHSNAKGAAPRSARVRSLPWQVCRWIGKTRPAVTMMENVREIRGWGPLIAKRCPRTGRVVRLDGSVAAKGERVPLREQQLVRDKRRMGRSYRRFVAHLRGLGCIFEARDLCCADYGIPTSRRRWFAVARLDGRPIEWMPRTHAPLGQAAALGLLPWVGAHTIIDWSTPMRSIFERAKPLAPATQRRIAVGLKRFVIDNPRPFIVPLTHTKSGTGAHDILDPLRTITTARGGEMALAAPATMVFRHDSPGIRITDPLPTLTANGHHKRPGGAMPIGVMAASLIQTGYGERLGQDARNPIGTLVGGGGKHALITAWMAQHNFGQTCTGAVDIDQPLSTVVTRTGPQAVAAAHLVKMRGTRSATAIDEPAPPLSAGGNHVAAVAAFLSTYYSQGENVQAADDPLHTITTKARCAVITAEVAGQTYAISDVLMRMLEPHEAAAAHGLRLPQTITIDGQSRRLTKSESIRLIGNSVPKRMATLLAQANRVHALDQTTPRRAVA